MDQIFLHAKKASIFVDSLKFETKGIHRYLPNERCPENPWKPYLSIFGLWVSGCAGLTTMSSFFLGPLLFGLGYNDTMILGLLGTLWGCLTTTYCSMMGPRSGLRQVCGSRYLFGPLMWDLLVQLQSLDP